MPLVALSQPGSYLFYGSILAWLVSEAVGGRVIPDLRRGGAVVRKRGHGSSTVILMSWVAIIAIVSGLFDSGVLPLPGWFLYAGVALMFAGIGVRQWAIYVLGRYFSPVIGTQRNQRVVDTGPYRLVRHPSYTGLLVLVVGMGLAAQSLAALAAITAIFALVFSYRIAVEERMLSSELGKAYTAYMRRTKRLIPFVV